MKPVALVTGGSRGIGFGVALELARRGFDLAINGRRPAGDVADAVDQLRAAGAQVLYLQADVAERAQHARMVDAIRGEFGRLNVLVNNAGVAPDVRADILDATEESFDRLIRINLRGPYFLTQAVAKWMIEQSRRCQASAGSGAGADRARFVIVNVSSISAEVASVNRGDYCISKAGVAMATRLWAVRLAEFGIDVFEVRPGIVATDM
ncbi:MAG: 3-ketoacyl-ACP reductase, partial [Phycisphaerae bacterium]|nr:3-ketoacyl-ACP reductase [Phycisphaerae bacterium]